MSDTKYLISTVIDEIQNLEELGGVDSIEQYVCVMTVIKLEIDKRIKAATLKHLSKGE